MHFIVTSIQASEDMLRMIEFGPHEDGDVVGAGGVLRAHGRQPDAADDGSRDHQRQTGPDDDPRGTEGVRHGGILGGGIPCTMRRRLP
ncbi:MAG: hypothetical protein ACOYK7_01490 [Pirellulales bacterium]